MSESVCYITVDNVVIGEKSHMYSNINPECVAQNSKRMGGDGPTSIKSGIVVAHNHYDNFLYKTQIETLDLGSTDFQSKYSQCYGPDSIRGVTSYYETSEAVLKACEISASICYIPMDDILAKNKLNIYKNVNADCLAKHSQPVSFDSGDFSLQSGAVVGIDPYGEIYKTQMKIPVSDSGQNYCSSYYPLILELSFFNTSEAVLALCKNRFISQE